MKCQVMGEAGVSKRLRARKSSWSHWTQNYESFNPALQEFLRESADPSKWPLPGFLVGHPDSSTLKSRLFIKSSVNLTGSFWISRGQRIKAELRVDKLLKKSWVSSWQQILCLSINIVLLAEGKIIVHAFLLAICLPLETCFPKFSLSDEQLGKSIRATFADSWDGSRNGDWHICLTKDLFVVSGCCLGSLIPFWEFWQFKGAKG